MHWEKQHPPAIPVDPGVGLNAPFLLSEVQRIADVGGSRHWTMLSVDGGVMEKMYKCAPCPLARETHTSKKSDGRWRSRAVSENDTLKSVALVGAFGHELWTYRATILDMLHPLVGRKLLTHHLGVNPSIKTQSFYQSHADKHKSGKWFKVRKAVCAVVLGARVHGSSSYYGPR